MARTRFERIEAGGPETAAFRIAGKLGFHENAKVEQLVAECGKRDFMRVVFDFSELESLGGGVARILRKFVQDFSAGGGQVIFVVTSDVVLDFLKDETTPIVTCATMEEALAMPVASTAPAETAVEEEPSPSGGDPTGDEDEPAGAGDPEAVEAAPDAGVIQMSYDQPPLPDSGSKEATPPEDDALVLEPHPVGGLSADGPAENQQRGPAGRKSEVSGGDKIISEIFGPVAGEGPPSWLGDPVSPFSLGGVEGSADVTELNRRLKRRILELKTLFSISTDFTAVRDRKKLLDIFLLTSIAQGGVESAVFFEKADGRFEPFMSKGIEHAALEPIELTTAEESSIRNSAEVTSMDLVPLSSATRKKLSDSGLVYLCPFHHDEGLAGIVMLGKRIAGRGMQKEDFEFMQVLVNLARGAYQNALLFEREHERTLGIVKTLISIIEENTLLKGTSEFVSRYVGMVAKAMDYPEEHFTDLIYGTVLRDMGMVKVSDLIVRSPRELTKDEWRIIKRHPEDGAEMLRRMKFSEHTIDIVLSHQERFNGEGYPRGMRGREIPLGSRIISVVESYAAMIHERPNRPALSEREALDTLKENYGLRYDREIVGHFAAIIEKELAKSVKPVETAV
jgi:HD-GYP domain-containing protein (c-di-GMP phosphodiesterase class II)/anti-anti-sigma regulatory factor